MLPKEQLQTIADALGNHPEATDDLKRIIQAELDYQASTAPLWADREQILAKPNLTQEDEARLAELAEALSAASDRRPAEFGGMFHAIDLIGQNIIRRASQLDRYSSDAIHLYRKDASQELPIDGEELLVWTDKGRIVMAEFNFGDGDYYWQPDGLPAFSGVTHWARVRPPENRNV